MINLKKKVISLLLLPTSSVANELVACRLLDELWVDLGLMLFENENIDGTAFLMRIFFLFWTLNWLGSKCLSHSLALGVGIHFIRRIFFTHIFFNFSPLGKLNSAREPLPDLTLHPTALQDGIVRFLVHL